MAGLTLVDRGRVDNIVIVVRGLAVTDDGVILGQVFPHVDLVDHQGHVN